MRSRTQLLDDALVLTASYQYVTLDLTNFGSLGSEMRNQVTFVIDGTFASGDNITLKPMELFSYQTGGVEQIGWSDKTEDSDTTAGALEIVERTFNLETQAGTPVSISFSTHADNIRLGLKGQGTVAVYANFAKVS